MAFPSSSALALTFLPPYGKISLFGVMKMDRRIWGAATAFGAAVLTAATLLTVYALYGLYPFGTDSLSWCDMDQQSVPLLMDFKDILSGNGNIFLNMGNAGGMEFWGVFFFFLASPFSFLVAFVEKSDMLTFMNILVLLKMAFSAVTASVFFTSCFKRVNPLTNTALSVSYALCGFGLMFYQNIIWLDMLCSFPLLLLSIRRLMEKKKPDAFICMLSLSVILNYYISYMLVIFILLGVPLWILICSPADERRRLSALFVVSCFTAALLTAVVWLPSLIQYLQSARGTGLLDSLKSGSFEGPYTTKFLLLMCTPLIFAAVPFISFKDNSKRRAAVWTSIMFALTLVASIIEPINKMWHTGSYQAFPLRYGYMIVFLGLVLAAYVIDVHDGSKMKGGTPKAFLGAAFCVTAVYLCGSILTENYFSSISKFTSTLWGDDTSFSLLLMWFMVGVFAFICLFALMKSNKLSKRVFSVFVSIAVIIGCVFNGGVYVGSAAGSDDSFRTEMDLAGRIDEDDFYRVKTRNKYFVVNQIGAMGYNSLAHYTSLTDEDYMFAMKKLGYSSYWMEVNSNGGTLMTDAVLQNDYSVSKNTTFAFSGNVVYQNDTYCIIESLFDMPAAVKLAADPLQYRYLPVAERSEIQNYIYRLYTGNRDSVVTKYEHTRISNVDYAYEDGLYSFTLPQDSQGRLYFEIWVSGRQSLYFDAFKDISNSLREALNDSFSVSVNGSVIQSSYPSQSSNGFVYLGDYEDEYVSVTVTVKKNAVASSFGVFSVDADKVEQACSNVSGCDIVVSGNTITAETEAVSGEYLYLPLPYADGYRATVNGEDVDIYVVNDAFMAIPLREGMNNIVLTYLPSGFWLSVILSLTGIAAFILLAVFIKLKSGKPVTDKANKAGTVSYIAVIIGAAATFAAVYIFPLIVYIIGQT